MPVIRAFETALNQGLLLESERHRHYFAFDTTELLKGDILKRYQAYQIGLANNFLQADEVRYKEDLKPLGFNFIRLGLQDVLLDPKTNTIYTPNTNQTTMFGQSVNQQVADSMIEETEQRWDGQRRESNGQFGKGKRPRSAQSKRKKNGSDKSSERLEKTDKNDIIKSRNISGALNPFSPAAEKHATQYYESVRHMKTDTIKISEATGIAKHKIDKIKNKEYVRRIIEATSLSALFTFLIERTIIPFATENFQCKISAIYMIAIFIALPVITFIVLFKKKEWNYNVD